MSLLSDILISETTTIPNDLGDIVKIVKCGEQQTNHISEVYCSWLISNKAQLKIGRVDLVGMALFTCCKECKRVVFSTENFILFLPSFNQLK